MAKQAKPGSASTQNIHGMTCLEPSTGPSVAGASTMVNIAVTILNPSSNNPVTVDSNDATRAGRSDRSLGERGGFQRRDASGAVGKIAGERGRGGFQRRGASGAVGKIAGERGRGGFQRRGASGAVGKIAGADKIFFNLGERQDYNEFKCHL